MFPRGVWVGDHFEFGLSAQIENGRVVSTSSSSAQPEDVWLSPAFVNAHSHLEYRPHLRDFDQVDYWPWIRNLAALKAEEDLTVVEEYTGIAARENFSAGIGWIGEHSDRPYSAVPLIEDLVGGRLFYELITFSSPGAEEARIAGILSKHAEQIALVDCAEGWEGSLSPHATWTVDQIRLRERASSSDFLSIHVAETAYEEQLFLSGNGPISELYERMSLEIPRHEDGVIGFLRECGMIRGRTQFVHGCDIQEKYVEELAGAGVSIAHCPRSNEALMCPDAPVREFLDAGILVGLGLDSPASSGPIDMFEEMRAALRASVRREQPLVGNEIWNMATTMGAASLELPGYDQTPWIAIRSQAQTVEELIATSKPEDVSWL
jgi:cytosine/adenosine deaminase-related metal-dependent hydrolase